MKKRAKSGDIFSVQLSNGQYMFGRVLLDIKQCFKSGIIEMTTSCLRYGSISYLVEIYDRINENNAPDGSFKAVIPGIVVDGGSFEDDTWVIIDNIPVDFKKLDFEEDIRFYSGKVVLARGELTLSKNTDDSKLKKFTGNGKGNSRTIFDCALTLLGKPELPLRKSADISSYDSRFADPELRKLVYDMLGEDINSSYYELALKHGFDTARFFNVSEVKEKKQKNDYKTILKGISWSFIGKKIASLQDFQSISKQDEIEISTETAYPDAEITISLEYTGADDEEHKMEFVLKADNGKTFKADELLFKIHNEVVESLDDNDFHFFQGLTLLTKASKNKPSIYSLDLGS